MGADMVGGRQAGGACQSHRSQSIHLLRARHYVGKIFCKVLPSRCAQCSDCYFEPVVQANLYPGPKLISSYKYYNKMAGYFRHASNNPCAHQCGHSNDWFCLCSYWRSALNVCILGFDTAWRERHPERYSRSYSAKRWLSKLVTDAGLVVHQKRFRQDQITKAINRSFQYRTSYAAQCSRGACASVI